MSSELYAHRSGQQPDHDIVDWPLQNYNVTRQTGTGNLPALPDVSYSQHQDFSGPAVVYNAAPQPQLHQLARQEMPPPPSHLVPDISFAALDAQIAGPRDYDQSPVPTSENPAQLPYINPDKFDNTIRLEQHRVSSETTWLPSYNLEPPWPDFNSQRFSSNLLGVPPEPGDHQQSLVQYGYGSSSLPLDYSDPSVVPSPSDHIWNTSAHPTALATPQGIFQCRNGASYPQWHPEPPSRNEHVASVRVRPEATSLHISPHRQAQPTTVGRKRPRTLTEAGEPPSSASQKAYGSNFAAGSLEIIPYKLPGSDSELFRVRKKTRRVDEKIDKACFTCRVKKRKCDPSGYGPCAICQAWLQRLAQQIPVPRFTCDIQTTFAKINLFPTRGAGIAAEDLEGLKDLLMYPPARTDHFRHILKPYVAILDILEPSTLRKIFWKNEHSAWYTGYIGILLKWKAALLYIAPGLRHIIGALEQIHMNLWRSFLAILDRPNLCKDKYELAIKYFACEEDFRIWRHLNMVDQNAADHVGSCFENRQTILGSMIQEEVNSIAKRSPKRATKMEWKDFRFGVAKFLKWRDPDARTESVWFEPRARSALPCPILESEQQESYRPGERSPCFCSWILNWLPIAYLQCFGYDAESFVQKLHHPGHIFHDFGSRIAPTHDMISELSRSSYKKITEFYSEIAEMVLHHFMAQLSWNASSEAALPWVTYCQTFDYVAEYDEVLFMLLSTSIWLMSDLVLLVYEEKPEEITIETRDTWLDGEGSRKLEALCDLLSSRMDEIISRRTSHSSETTAASQPQQNKGDHFAATGSTRSEALDPSPRRQTLTI